MKRITMLRAMRRWSLRPGAKFEGIPEAGRFASGRHTSPMQDGSCAFVAATVRRFGSVQQMKIRDLRTREVRGRAARRSGLRWACLHVDAGEPNDTATHGKSSTFFSGAVDVLCTADPLLKAQRSRVVCQEWRAASETEKASWVNWYLEGGSAMKVHLPHLPARPSEPRLVASSEMPNVKQCGFSAAIFYLHAVAHVELNAIDLCWDTMLRFGLQAPVLPVRFYDDFISIADDESRHYMMLDTRLKELGTFYGALPAHSLIWQSADRSRVELSARLALGQLVQEARGLDAGPRLVSRLHGLQDPESASIIGTIAKEEVDHVRIGMDWYLFACEREEICNPLSHFHRVALERANIGAFYPPFNEEIRSSAGLMPEWYWPVAEQLHDLLRGASRTKSQRRVPDRGHENAPSHGGIQC